jgi:hypothetical protein
MGIAAQTIASSFFFFTLGDKKQQHHKLTLCHKGRMRHSHATRGSCDSILGALSGNCGTHASPGRPPVHGMIHSSLGTTHVIPRLPSPKTRLRASPSTVSQKARDPVKSLRIAFITTAAGPRCAGTVVTHCPSVPVKGGIQWSLDTIACVPVLLFLDIFAHHPVPWRASRTP